MSLREDMLKYEQITGESAEHVPIIKLGAFLDGYDIAIKALEQQRKRGKWIFREDMGYQYCCSECGCPKPFVNDYYYKKVIGCPYCLADMRGDNDEI